MARISNIIIYFAPHQDDELLSMGVDICNSIKKGKDVHVVLCTDGSSSGVKNILKNGKTCKKHSGEHIYDLTVEQFIKARDDEFIASCLALGVKKENIHIPDVRGKDGALDLNTAQTIIRHFLKEIDKKAVICTISQNNGPKQHRDHKTLGRAVENLTNWGEIRKRKLFVEPYHYRQVKDNARLIPIEPEVLIATSSAKDNINNAINAYSYWNPQEKRYAVGYHSVTNEFNDYIKDTTNRFFVKFSPKHISKTDKLYIGHRKYLKLQKQKQLYYSMEQCDTPDLGNNILVRILGGQVEEYRQFCQQHNVTLTEKNLKRIQDGSSFWCITNTDKEILTRGWMAYKHHFYIGETDFDFDMKQSEAGLLYNFETNEKYRGQGLYSQLLKSIVSQAKQPKDFVIYTSRDNLSSQRGILKAGFKSDGTLKAEDRSLLNYLKSKGFTAIKRKYRLWGLYVEK
ncbi:MAG: PIG-L family deacetylase [Oscillospiraceae bacterium]|nr:PIG-L family deacetylase [Oscillospiraceae bacterium]